MTSCYVCTRPADVRLDRVAVCAWCVKAWKLNVPVADDQPHAYEPASWCYRCNTPAHKGD